MGEIRIVGGSRRGHRVKVPSLGAVRPTSERVREAVFDVLGPLDGERVLDLFAGSGALGLEALSLGAGCCLFVEKDPRVAAVLRANVERLRFGEVAVVMTAHYLTALRLVVSRTERYDVLFLDPPYRMLQEVTAKLEPWLARVMEPGGVLVVEGPKGGPARFNLKKVFERDYGDTLVGMWRTDSL